MTGTSAAIQLSTHPSVQVDLFDWGRQAGGRSATRNLFIDQKRNETFAPPGKRLAFDHGLQFIKTNNTELIRSLRAAGAVEWQPASGWLSRGTLHVPGSDEYRKRSGNHGFLSVLDSNSADKVFVSKDGMSELCTSMQQEAISTGRVRVHQQCRVVGIRRAASRAGGVGPSWIVDTDRAHHEQTAEHLVSSRQEERVEVSTSYDAIIFTEHMMWLPPWHPCHLHGMEEIAPQAIT